MKEMYHNISAIDKKVKNPIGTVEADDEADLPTSFPVSNVSKLLVLKNDY